MHNILQQICSVIQIELTGIPTHELKESAGFQLHHPLEHISWTPSNIFEQKEGTRHVLKTDTKTNFNESLRALTVKSVHMRPNFNEIFSSPRNFRRI
ncbi:hypothetical protein QL285_081961 [Trifolium repens]|nr:hypothetical protein QL285_081961 [Trifolium repens]